jgi:hypothetical protein
MSHMISGRAHRRRLAIFAALTCTLGLTGFSQLSAHAAPAAARATSAPETRPFEPGEDEAGADIPAPRSNAPSHVPAAHVPRPATLAVAQNPAAKAAEGLSLKDQRDSNGGNAFSLEPPDQALCVNGTQIIEGVNDVFTIYDKATGRRTAAPKSYVSFFNNGAVEVDRSPTADPDHIFGPFVSDPKCYWDPALRRFYMTVLQLGTDPATGDFDGRSFENIAVSKTATPTTAASSWFLYRLDVANNGRSDRSTANGARTRTTPTGRLAAHQGCPCLGDQPLIGADTFGFYVTTNEFSIDGPEFNGAQIYAFDKAALSRGVMKVQRIENDGPTGLPLAEGTAYSVQPATSPVASEWSTANGGTEFALSALDFAGGLDNRIARWALTNTSSLTGSHPAVHLSKTVLRSEVYGMPPMVQQRRGPYPLGQSERAKLNLLNSNDDRMNQVVYSGGKLWSGVNTAVKTHNGPTTAGIAYFVVRAGDAAMTNQGYVAVNRNSVMFPAIGVGARGANPSMVFTLAGRGFYPSTAYVRFTSGGSLASPVTVYGAGTRPADGFTGYPDEGGNGVERWGDYSAAVADASGTVWLATEYIPGTFGFIPGSRVPPSYIANWGTAIGRVSNTR